MKRSFVAVVGIVLSSCAQDPAACTADSSGFGSAPTVKLTSLVAPSVAAGNPCRSRFEILRTQADFASAYTELGAGDAPAIDFVNQVIVVRVSADPAGIQWSVLDKGGLVVGLRGCRELSETCSASFYSVPGPITGLDSRTCEAVHCGFAPSQ